MVSLSFFRRKKLTKPLSSPAVPPKKTVGNPGASGVKGASEYKDPFTATGKIAQASNTSLPHLPSVPIIEGPSPQTSPPQATSYTSLVDDYADSVAVSLTPSQENRKLRPPALNTDLPIFSEPTSPSSRRLTSSTSRHPRASFIRHSRVLSGSSTIAGGLNSMFSPLQTLRNRQKSIITDLPPELLPVVNLTNSQRLRQYVSGSIGVLTEDGLAWLTADANLTGTELLIWVLGHEKPRFLNIQDCSILPSKSSVPGDDELYDLHILQDYDLNVTSLRFGDSTDMSTWLAAMQLSKFEHTSLSEAFTAVVLSLKGPQLSDIYTLLSHKKRFTRFEWCNVRLPQVSNKWIKVFMAIIPGDSKTTGRIEIYSSEKITKKNLILYVNDVTSAYNIYPEDHHMIDHNLIMKLEGEAFVNKLFEHLFSGQTITPTSPKVRSRPNSISSIGSLGPPGLTQASGTRSRSTSINSSSSFFTHAPSPKPEGAVSQLKSPTAKSKHFFKKQSVNNFVTTNYLYLMPEPHPGVSAVEIMLRNFVHIIDAFKLYGRPEHLNSDKKNPISMLFGLPALPHYCYLDMEEVSGLVAANVGTARLQKWGLNEWRACLKAYLACKQKDEDFKGCGNIYELFSSVDAESDEGSIPDRTVSPAPLPSRALDPHEDRSVPQARYSHGYDGFQQVDSNGISGSLNAEYFSGEGLGKPIDFADNGAEYRDVSNTLNGPGGPSSRKRTLQPIMDLPTPIDDSHGASYFVKESQIPLRV